MSAVHPLRLRRTIVRTQREDRAVDPTTPFAVMPIGHPHPAFRCVSPACNALSEGCGLFCSLHLWTFDNPALAGAPILGKVVVL